MTTNIYSTYKFVKSHLHVGWSLCKSWSPHLTLFLCYSHTNHILSILIRLLLQEPIFNDLYLRLFLLYDYSLDATIIFTKCLEIKWRCLVGGCWVFSVLTWDRLSFCSVQTWFDEKNYDDNDQSEDYEEHEFDETLSFVVCSLMYFLLRLQILYFQTSGFLFFHPDLRIVGYE